MKKSEFYLNDKIVSVALCDKIKSDEFIWCDEITYTTYYLGRKKTLKFDTFKWISSFEISSYSYTRRIDYSFNTTDELLKHLNSGYLRRYIVMNNKLYIAPVVQITYVNRDCKTIFFDTFESAEKYYNDLKKKFNGEYIIFL